MPVRIGIDAVEIDRIARSMKNPRFLERVFTPEECAYFEVRRWAPQTVAGHFAAKEAFSKAVGTGFRDGLQLEDVAVWHTPEGQPWLHLSGSAAELVRGASCSLSITHTGQTAMAVVLIDCPDPKREEGVQ